MRNLNPKKPKKYPEHPELIPEAQQAMLRKASALLVHLDISARPKRQLSN